ncbi:hypothetical protein CSPX01_14563 [Colletotrichum filicis]|nr:hypothetical protein CSPX01_14563 [Colletotrichum filicis]
MSGFEIAGLVLGAIPLITKAFDDYRRVVASVQVWRHYEVEVSCLILNLNSEYYRLERICGKYLSSLDPGTDFDSMTSDPFGPLWKDEVVQRKIKARLESSYGKFQLVMEEFRKAINFIKDKLDLDAQWKVKWTEESKIKAEFKRASFVLQKSVYKDALESLQKNLSILDSMMKDDMDAEPQRQKRYKGRLVGLIRQTSGNIYYALRDSMPCKIDCRHQVHMDIAPDSEDATHELDDAEIIEKLGFQLAMTYHTNTSEVIPERPGQQIILEEVTVRASAPQVASLLEPTPATQSPSHPQRKAVSFASSRKTTVTTTYIKQPSTTAALTSTMSTLKLTAGAINLPRQVNMCEELRRSHENGISGTISHQNAGKSWNFTIYPKKTTETPNSRSVISLKQILENPPKTKMPFMAKIHLAKMISSSFLQLHQTPWLPNILTSQDVYFITDGSRPYPNLKQAFIKKELPGKFPKDRSMNIDARGLSSSPLLSLGILLLELELGTTIGKLRRPDEPSDADVVERLLEETPLDAFGSGRYKSAVFRCVGGNYFRSTQDFNDENFRKAVYERVVAPLEADLEEFTL